jgi:hypothetical protein
VVGRPQIVAAKSDGSSMGSLPTLATRSCVSPERGTGARRSARYSETEPLLPIIAKNAAPPLKLVVGTGRENLRVKSATASIKESFEGH